MFWKYQNPKTKASFLIFLGLGLTCGENSPSSETALRNWFVGFGENSKGCERNLLKEFEFVSEWWIWDMGLRESFELWNLLRRFGLSLWEDALMEKWWFGFVTVTEYDDDVGGKTFKDNIFV